jgi:hypothetical protein
MLGARGVGDLFSQSNRYPFPSVALIKQMVVALPFQVNKLSRAKLR